MGTEIVAADSGLLLVRVVIGLLVAGHGAQKLFGWFGGDGLAETAEQMSALGYRNGWAMAVIAGLTEIAAGLGLAFGIAVPLIAAGIIGTMFNAAVTVHLRAGLWNQNGGYEYPLVLATVAAGLAVHGPGSLSADAVMGLEATGIGPGLIAIGVGLVAAVIVLMTRRRSSSGHISHA